MKKLKFTHLPMRSVFTRINSFTRLRYWSSINDKDWILEHLGRFILEKEQL